MFIFNIAAAKVYRGELLVLYLWMYACVCSHRSSSSGITFVPLDITAKLGTNCSCASFKGMMCTSLSCENVTIRNSAGISCLFTLGTDMILLGIGGNVVVYCIGAGVSFASPFLFI